MCYGETLLGLPEDPSEKELMAALTSADDTCKAANRAEDDGSHGVLRLEGAFRFFSWNAFTVSKESGAGVSSEQIILIVALNCLLQSSVKEQMPNVVEGLHRCASG